MLRNEQMREAYAISVVPEIRIPTTVAGPRCEG